MLYRANVVVFSEINTKHIAINPLKTQRALYYIKTKFVPRSKHFSISVIKNQLML